MIIHKAQSKEKCVVVSPGWWWRLGEWVLVKVALL